VTDGLFLDRALQAHQGTVTEFLEALAGESVEADKLAQQPSERPPRMLSGPPSQAITRRTVVLRGRRTLRPFVFADSLLATDRLPSAARSELESTNEPIGRVLARHAVVVRRRELPQSPVAPSLSEGALAQLVRRASLSRSYCLLLNGDPAIEIDEWFLPAVEEALRGRLAPS
jgi:chorismate-pyruvate lyase